MPGWRMQKLPKEPQTAEEYEEQDICSGCLPYDSECPYRGDPENLTVEETYVGQRWVCMHYDGGEE